MHILDAWTGKLLLDREIQAEGHSQSQVSSGKIDMKNLRFPRITILRLMVLMGLTVAINFLVIENVTDIIWTHKVKIKYKRDNTYVEPCTGSKSSTSNKSAMKPNISLDTEEFIHSDYHYRFYMNPVKAFLLQKERTQELINEIRMVYSEHYQRDIVAKIPKVATMNGNTPKNVSSYKMDVLTNQTLYRDIDCLKLFNNDLNEFMKAEIFQMHTVPQLPTDFDVFNATQNCDEFKESREYVLHSVTKEEEDFPIAFSILVYKDTLLLERLLRAIYRPQNFYCVHVDQKSPRTVHLAAQSLANCFSNVIMASRPISVEWGGYSVLEADIVCLRDLWEISEKSNRKWKYFINLTGQEFPLKTNWEIVQILKAYNGAVDAGATISKEWNFRTECTYYWHLKNTTCLKKKAPLKYNFTLAKGPVHVAMSRHAAEFTLFNETAQYLLQWLNGTLVPDESFFAMLFSSPQLGIPGAYRGAKGNTKRSFHPLVRFKKWRWWRPCHGKAVRHICIATMWDLPELKLRPEMFVNKLERFHHWPAYSCLEELHLNKTREEMAAVREGLRLEFDTSAYKELPWIRNHV